MVRVAVDALGGDNAPDVVVAGALEAAAEGIDVTLFGPEGIDTGGLPLVDAPGTIDMAEKAVEAVRVKTNSSLVAAVRAVAAGDADAVVSAGNTGAMLAAGLFHLRRAFDIEQVETGDGGNFIARAPDLADDVAVDVDGDGHARADGGAGGNGHGVDQRAVDQPAAID